MDRTQMGPPKNIKLTKRQSVLPSSSRRLPPKDPKIRQKLNTTSVSECDQTLKIDSADSSHCEDLKRLSAHQKCLRDVLGDCLVDMKIKREETEIDIQMTQLADRFNKTVEQLDKTNRRLKDISFVVEQKRLLDLKSVDYSNFYETTDGVKAQDILSNLATSEQVYLDKLETKNIDFGYHKESGHKQLLDAVNDAIHGLEQIKKHSNLNIDKMKQFEMTEENLDSVEKEKFDINNLKVEFEKKFPNFSEKLLQEVSEKIEIMMKNE